MQGMCQDGSRSWLQQHVGAGALKVGTNIPTFLLKKEEPKKTGLRAPDPAQLRAGISSAGAYFSVQIPALLTRLHRTSLQGLHTHPLPTVLLEPPTSWPRPTATPHERQPGPGVPQSSSGCGS